ncbi:hypothetical protein [Krasilnikovia sp. MM14-A1259]|uniref:hypothetical protein n=1 Tax=Krasilnikovia sp. MM14-A1259 TaxID=3373539 RepID=UPI003824FA8F
MSVPATDWPTSPLSAAATAFAALTCEPDPMTLDLDQLDPDAGLPAGVMTLTDLDHWLAKHRHAFAARDAVWRELVRRARIDGPEWVIAAVGMAMPALRRYAVQLAIGYRGDRDDMDAEVLTGFLCALRERVDLARPAPHAALCMAAFRAGRDHARQSRQYIPVDDVEHVTGPRTPMVPWGHPDLLVRRAVQLGLVDETDEQPYIDVRLGQKAIEPIAAGLGVTTDALRMRLGRIDTRLADALGRGLLTGAVSADAAQLLAEQADRRAALRASRAVPSASGSATSRSHPAQLTLLPSAA